MIKLTPDQIAQLKALAVGGWKAGRSQNCTHWSHREMNLNTARSFIRKGLARSPRINELTVREAKDVFPGHSLEITQAGRDWLEENARTGD